MKEEYFVYLERDGRVTIPLIPSKGMVEYLEVSPKTIKNWSPSTLGQTVKTKEITFYEEGQKRDYKKQIYLQEKYKRI